MKICPSCKEEFIDEIMSCALCQKDLLDENDAHLAESEPGLLSKEELLKSETVAFTEGPIAQCREFEKILGRALISSAIYPLNFDAGNQALGSATEAKYCLLVRSVDIEAAQLALSGHFQAQIIKEGHGVHRHEAVDLSQEFITCPACLESITLVDGDCPSCGLTLGV